MKTGDRVKLSPRGRRVAMSKRDRVGMIHGYSNDGYPRVTWDGNRGPESWYPDFLELAPEEPKHVQRSRPDGS